MQTISIQIKDFIHILRSGAFDDVKPIGMLSNYKWGKLVDLAKMHGIIQIFANGLERYHYDSHLNISESLINVIREELRTAPVTGFADLYDVNQMTLQSNNIYCLKRKFVWHRIRQQSTMGKHYSKRNLHCYLTVIDELFKFQDSPIIRKFAGYTLSKVFYTGHLIPTKEKFEVFWRAVRSGYLKYIGFKSIIVFWFKKR